MRAKNRRNSVAPAVHIWVRTPSVIDSGLRRNVLIDSYWWTRLHTDGVDRRRMEEMKREASEGARGGEAES